jgi:N-acetylglutamate synthase-like GNAT family acetyltransferase
MLRVLTDGEYRALIDDMVISEEFRRLGYGRRLMEAALAHPRVRNVETVFLFAEVPAFYAQLGFSPDQTGMKLTKRLR